MDQYYQLGEVLGQEERSYSLVCSVPKARFIGPLLLQFLDLREDKKSPRTSGREERACLNCRTEGAASFLSRNPLHTSQKLERSAMGSCSPDVLLSSDGGLAHFATGRTS